MNKELIIIGAMISMLVLTTSASNLSAQNATTNASHTMGNMTTSANETASEIGQNTSAINRTELAQNASSAFNKSGISLGETGKNASDVGGDILNKTGETAKKIGEGAAGVLGNLTGEIKQGISGNTSK
jgi:hypothetical protein